MSILMLLKKELKGHPEPIKRIHLKATQNNLKVIHKATQRTPKDHSEDNQSPPLRGHPQATQRTLKGHHS